MKLKTTFATLSVLSVLSFSAFAATAINAEQAKDRESMGTISFDGIEASPDDMHEMISKQADKQGASAYRIIEARTGDHWHTTAELYK